MIICCHFATLRLMHMAASSIFIKEILALHNFYFTVMDSNVPALSTKRVGSFVITKRKVPQFIHVSD
uniref:Uncharacterized protein n=1 Tax=Rhizophora mucronata TaxID=61149 RepID=A0A2P2LVX3_RHIMU